MSTIEARLARLEATAALNQQSVESIGNILGEIVSCLTELKSEVKAANRQRIIASAILANRQDLNLLLSKYGLPSIKPVDFDLRKFYDLEVILKLFQRGLTAVVPKASSYPCNAHPQNDQGIIAFFVDAIHELTGTKPIIKRNGSDCIISYPE
eukprot:scaffold2909_cov78-Cylindrotheca_fusiformis.AAC.6